MDRSSNILGMIDDLSGGTLAELLGLSEYEEHTQFTLTQRVRDAYLAGTIDAVTIMVASEAEQAEVEANQYKCGICGHGEDEEFDNCPNCGAPLDSSWRGGFA